MDGTELIAPLAAPPLAGLAQASPTSQLPNCALFAMAVDRNSSEDKHIRQIGKSQGSDPPERLCNKIQVRSLCNCEESGK